MPVDLEQLPADIEREVEGLIIHAPPSTSAGESLTVQIVAAARVRARPVTLAFSGSAGLRLYSAQLVNGRAEVLIPGTDTREAGAATLVVASGVTRAEARVEIVPGPPVEPIKAIVGARSSIADGRHWSMAVVIPVDALGNPVAEGTPVELKVLHPGEVLEWVDIRVRHQLAWARIFTRTRAGRSVVVASSLGKHGPESVFEEVPGWPVPFSLRASPSRATPDGRRFLNLRTEPIRDAYDNVMLDGTLITFVSREGAAESRFIPAFTLDGVAKTLMQAPRTPVVSTILAGAYGTTSAPLTVAFEQGPAVGSFPVQVRVDRANHALAVEIGPLLGPLEQFVAEGLPVEATLTDSQGQSFQVQTIVEGGYARAQVRLVTLSPGAYRVDVELGSGRGSTSFQID